MTTVDSDSSGTNTALRRYKFREAVLSDIGLRRNENQDAYGIAHTAGTSLFVVADGMGGARGGATASAMAIHVIINNAIKQNGLITRPSLKDAIEKANAAIYRRSKDDEDLSGMGTTVVALAFVNECAIVAHVGDSRIYRFRDGEIVQLTHDHTLVQELVDSGAIPKEEAENHPIAHMLTRSLGPTPHVEVEIQALPDPTQRGDRFLLCSDGLYNLVTEAEIGEHLREFTPAEVVEKLIKLALERGGTDNVTIEALEVVEVDDTSLAVEYPASGEVRFAFSEGVAAPELRSILDDPESGSEVSEDTQRGLPTVGDLSDDEDAALAQVFEDSASGTSVPIVKAASGDSRFRVQASIFFVVALTAGIFGFFLYQYGPARNAASVSSSGVGEVAVSPDGALSSQLQELQTPATSTETTPATAAGIGQMPSSIPSMAVEKKEPTAEEEAQRDFLLALAVPEAPYIQVRDPQVASMEATRPIVWENEQKKVEELLSSNRSSSSSAMVPSASSGVTALLSKEEKLFLLQEKATLRDRIADLDSKLRVLGFFSKAEADEVAKQVNQRVQEKGSEIVNVRRQIDELRSETAKWSSRLDLARGRSAIRLAEEVSTDYEELAPVFEAFSRSSERYAKAVDSWQAEPNDVVRATEMGTSGRELQQARVALEQRLTVFVGERVERIGNQLAKLQLEEELTTAQRDQLSRLEGYLKGFTELTPARRKELRDAYYKDRGELAQQLAGLVKQLDDREEIALRLESLKPKSS